MRYPPSLAHRRTPVAASRISFIKPTLHTKLDAIQGLRGFAALLVVADHSWLHFPSAARFAAETKFQLHALAEALGHYGVEIFFVISGFIMTATSANEFAARGAPSRFLRRRIFRVVPLYWLSTLALIIALLFRDTHTGSLEVMKSLLFIPYSNDDHVFQPILRRGWTLNYEMFFYLLFAAALFLPGKRGLTALLSVLAAAAILGQVGMFSRCDGTLCELAFFYSRSIILYFALGVCLGLIRDWMIRTGRLHDARPSWILASTLVAAAIYAAGCYGGDARIVELLTPLLVIVPVALGALTHIERPMSGPIFFAVIVIGDASYSIYLTHSFFIDPAARAWRLLSNGSNLVLYFAIMLLGSCAVGYLTYRWIEQPILRRLKRWQ